MLFEKIQLNNTIVKFTKLILLSIILFYDYNTKITCYLSVVQKRFNSSFTDSRNDKIIR
jgi:hypothetical protein